MKKLLRSFCAALCCIGILTSMGVASSASEIESRLAQISQLEAYKPGASTFGANGCWVFVNSVSNLLYGINIPNCPNGYLLEGALGYWDNVAYAYNESATNENVAKLLATAQAGDIIQYRCSWATWQHTAMIYSNSNNGTVTLYDFANLKVYKRDVNLGNLPGTIGNFGGVQGYGMTLYRCKHDVSTQALPGGGDSGSNYKSYIAVTTKGADTITETSAILRGDVKSSGARVTECGMYIGTSKDDLKLLGSDKGLSTYGTPSYYSTSKYGYPLEPGTTYYYQSYAVVGGKTEKGAVESFTTRGIKPTPTPIPSPTPTPTSKPTSTPTPTPVPPSAKPAAKSYKGYIDTTGLLSEGKYCERIVDGKGNPVKISVVYLFEAGGNKLGSLKSGDAVTVEPDNVWLISDTDDILVYVTSDAGSGYVWEAYLSDTKPAQDPRWEPYKAYIDLSKAEPNKYCDAVTYEYRDRPSETKVTAAVVFKKEGGAAASLKPGTAVTVKPDEFMYASKDSDDILVYVTSSEGSGYVWDGYLSKVKVENKEEPTTPPAEKPSTPSKEPEPPKGEESTPPSKEPEPSKEEKPIMPSKEPAPSPTPTRRVWQDQGWTSIKPQESDTLKILETRTVTDTEGYTEYTYYHYWGTANGLIYMSYGNSYWKNYEEVISREPYKFSKTYDGKYDAYNAPGGTPAGTHGNIWWFKTMRIVPSIYRTEYHYYILK